MELKLISFRDLSEIEYTLALGLGPITQRDILVVSFAGTCGIGSSGDDDAAFMRAIVAAALDAWSPSGLVLDLWQLRYEWGDRMMDVLCSGERWLPVAVVVSGLCREGLTSLVQREMLSDPAHWLFDNLDAAVKEVETQMQATEGRVDAPDQG